MEGKGALWLVAGPLILLKVWATGLLLFYQPTRAALYMAFATGWPWLVVLLVLVGPPLFAWYRLVKVRARRAQLRRSEWMVDEVTRPIGGGTASTTRDWR
ncbi:MAG: hypothetical protein HYX52_00985 [Chloroflexi bacterium]|nr:hypothetical protein [Chloroflexota bacterium]